MRQSTSLRIAMLVSTLCILPACQTLPVEIDTTDYDPSVRERFNLPQRVGTAKNIILFVGDGMGVSTVTAARIYAGQRQGGSGEEHSLNFEQFPHLALIKTYNTNQQVPDSAGTATAMVSGVKTRAGVINVRPEVQRGDCAGVTGHELINIATDARRAGKAAGLVTTTRITHATPATLYAISSERDYESDAYMSASEIRACEDIAAQFVGVAADEALNVTFGGGRGEFVGADFGGIRQDPSANLIDGWLAADSSRVFVENRDQLARLDATDANKQVLGLFSRSHLAYSLARKPDTTEPTLAEMTAKAIDLLGENPEGFFLLVEGGRIDHGHHIGRAGLALADTEAFAAAIEAALERVDLDETLLLVTADHSHTLTLAGYPTRGNPILGLVVSNDASGEPLQEPVIAGDGQPYTSVGYANGPGFVDGKRPAPEIGPSALIQGLVPTKGQDRDGTVYNTETHGGEDVALYAAGPWSHLVGGVLEQQAIYHIMRHAFGWAPKRQ